MIPDFFDDSGLTLVQRRVQQLSETDLARQLWFIRASLTTLAMEGGHAVWHVHRPVEPQRGASREQLLAVARDIGDKLELLALRGNSGVDATWIGLTFVNEKHWMLTPLGLDLYSGVPGVALFLAHLGVLTTEIRFTNLAQAALVTIQQLVEHGKSFVTSIGGFSGWSGLIYTLSHLGVLWDRSDLLDEAEALVERLPDLIEKDAEFDIIGGAAGCIGVLASLHHCRPSKRTLAVAVECGDRLIAQAQRLKHGTGWVGSGTESGKPLTGFSHGVAGIALSLLKLASLTGEERFRAVAVEALLYERSLFSPQHGNWPDLDSPDPLANEEKNSYSYMNAWCHGAPGIGLGRVQMLQHMDDAEIREEIDTAIQTTLRHGFGMNHSLCHGSLGNLELLLQSSLTLDNLELKKRTYCIAAGILNSMKEYGWQCGVPLGVETPGLMTGLAGIGYGLLRLAAPERVPSVLTLEPPRL